MRRYLLDTGIMGDFIKGWRFERHAGIAARELGDNVSNRDSRVRSRRFGLDGPYLAPPAAWPSGESATAWKTRFGSFSSNVFNRTTSPTNMVIHISTSSREQGLQELTRQGEHLVKVHDAVLEFEAVDRRPI